MKRLVPWLMLLCLAPTGTGAESPATGKIEGRITFTGVIPKSKPDDAGTRHDLLKQDQQTRGLQGVVIYVLPANGVAFRARPGGKAATKPPLVDQVDYAFTPRVTAVQEGETVVFRNSDPANHNVRASGRNNEFNVFTGMDGTYEHRFIVETNYRPVRLGCDIHPWMGGWVYVFNHPHFAVTDAQGNFEIPGLPPGEYEFHVAQPDINYHQHRRETVVAGETTRGSTLIHREEEAGTDR